jgi:hypothetical protein
VDPPEAGLGMKGPLAPPNEFEGATQSVSSLHFEPVLLSLVIDRSYLCPVRLWRIHICRGRAHVDSP